MKPATLEADVKSTLSKVELGEVDAGIVWVTDVRAAAGKVKGIDIPANLNVASPYPIAIVAASHNLETAKAFVAYVLSTEGQAALAAAGFQRP